MGNGKQQTLDKKDILNQESHESIMKTYLEISVPIKYDDLWFKNLRTACRGIPVKWQEGYYHITMAFCDETPKDVDLRPILEKHLVGCKAPVLTFDRLDAFSATSGMYIVNLGVSNIPTEFVSLVENVRTDLEAAGCVMQSDFKLHVTLGRINDARLNLLSIQEQVRSVPRPSFSLQLTDVDYRMFRGRVIYNIRLTN